MSIDNQSKNSMTPERKELLLKINGLDTRAKLMKYYENKIRAYYSKVFKNENCSLSKQGINIKSNMGTLSKTRKKQGFKIPTKKITLKESAETIITNSNTAPTLDQPESKK